jgi:hypothetical protein
MDTRELAKLLVEQLRWYMREKLPHNNIIAIPVLDLFAWGAQEGTVLQGGTADLERASRLLHDAKICQQVLQQTRSGQTVLQLQMTEEGRAMTDDEIIGRLFSERS